MNFINHRWFDKTILNQYSPIIADLIQSTFTYKSNKFRAHYQWNAEVTYSDIDSINKWTTVIWKQSY